MAIHRTFGGATIHITFQPLKAFATNPHILFHPSMSKLQVPKIWAPQNQLLPYLVRQIHILQKHRPHRAHSHRRQARRQQVTSMDRHIEVFLKRLSYIALTIGTLTFLLLLLKVPDTCVAPDSPPKPHLRFPKHSCDHRPRQHLPLHKKNKRLWSSATWQNQVRSFSLFFHSLNQFGLLHNHSKVLCVSAGAGHEVMALQKLGVDDVTGIELLDSPPLVSRADPHNLPFFDDVFDVAFSARLELALFPSRFAAEMERTVRPGGVCVVVVEECGEAEVKEVAGLFRDSRFLGAMNVTLTGLRMTRIIMRVKVSP